MGLLIASSAARGAIAAERFVPLSGVGDALPRLPLVAQNAAPFTLAALRGNAVALSFIYTRCPDPAMCPLTTAKFTLAQGLIGNAPIRLVLLTLDPHDDTPAVLARYGQTFGENARYLTFATGTAARLDELAGRLGIATTRSAPGTIVHNEAAVILAPDGRIARIIDGNVWSPSELVAAARATLPGSDDGWVGARAWLSAALERCGGGSVILTGMTMLGVLASAIGAVGAAFWLAFRHRPS